MRRHTFTRSIKLVSNMKLEVSNYHSAGPRMDMSMEQNSWEQALYK